MSVPASKRGKSKTEFFHSAYKLNDEITQLLLREVQRLNAEIERLRGDSNAD